MKINKDNWKEAKGRKKTTAKVMPELEGLGKKEQHRFGFQKKDSNVQYRQVFESRYKQDKIDATRVNSLRGTK